ncbi:MAG: ABC transporter permease [Allosphingosinicella sp.]
MAKPNHLWLLFKLQLTEYIRDPLAAGFSFALPFLFLVTFGITSTAAENRTSDVALVRPAAAAAADTALLESTLAAEPTLVVKPMAESDAMRALSDKSIDAVVVTGDPPSIVVRGEGKRFGDWLGQRLELGVYRTRAGTAGSFAIEVRPLAGAAKRTAFDFIAPGIFALALLQLGLFGTGNQILLARARGTFRRLRSTPLADRDIIGAHILVRLLIAVCQIAFLALAANLAFGLEFQGGLWRFVLVGVTGGVALSLLGYAIGGVAPTAQSGSMMIMLANFFMMFAGQVFFDMRGSTIGKIFTHINPVSSVADSFRYAVSGEAQALPFWTNQLIVCGWALVMFVVTIRFFKYSMENA